MLVKGSPIARTESAIRSERRQSSDSMVIEK